MSSFFASVPASSSASTKSFCGVFAEVAVLQGKVVSVEELMAEKVSVKGVST